MVTIKKNLKIAEIFYIFAGIILLAIVLRELQHFLRPFTIAVIFTLLLMSLTRLSKKWKLPVSMTITFAIVTVLVSFAALVFLSISIFSQSDVVESQLQDQLLDQQIAATITERVLVPLGLTGVLSQEGLETEVSFWLAESLGATRAIISEFFLALLFTLFLAPSRNLFTHKVRKKLSHHHRRKFDKALENIEGSIATYIGAKTFISVLTGAFSAIVLFSFGAKYVLLVSFAIFILNFIPSFGSIAGAFLGSFTYAFTVGFTPQLTLVVLLLAVIQIVLGNVIEPKFAGSRLHISPILLILNLFVWYWIWGIVGMMLATPLLAIIKIIIQNLEATHFIAKYSA